MVKNREKINVIFDTDIGTNPDDFFALLMLLLSKNVNLRLIVTGNCFPLERAYLAHRIISFYNKHIEIVPGNEKGRISFFADKYIDGYRPLLKEDYCNTIKEVIDKYGEVYYIVVQGLSNMADFLRKFPNYRDKVKIFHMGMTTKGANKRYIGGGTNMEADSLSAKFIYESRNDLVVIGAHTTINDKLRIHPGTEIYKNIKKSKNAVHGMLFSHLQDYYLRRKIWPALHDPLTVSVALGKDFVNFEKIFVSFNKNGKYKLGGKTKVKISKGKCDYLGFMNYINSLLF